jgi:hypothetical protein
MSAVSWFTPGGADPQLQAESVREQQRQSEMKAEQYAALHQDADDGAPRVGAIRRAVRRARAALSRRP